MIEVLLKEFEHILKETTRALHDALRGIRSGRPAPELLENIEASYFDQMMPLKQLGTISVRPPRELAITVWDQNAVGAVMKAIEEAKVGVSLSNEGNTIRAFLPPLSAERREELAKLVKRTAEEARINVRAHRDDAMKKIKAAEAEKEIGEDVAFKGKERVQKIVDDANQEIEVMVTKKIAELNE